MELAVLPSRNTILLRSLANMLLGAILLIWPGLTLYILVLIFAINILIIGLATLFEPAFDKSNKSSVLTVILGLLGVAAGIFLLVRPGITASIIAILIAIWAIIFGISDIYVGFAAKIEGGARILFVLMGMIALLFGVYVLSSPLEGILSLIWAIGFYAIIVGVIMGVVGLFFYPKVKK
jgi:uncharacterized membrane protein HdeD (DUF308 family)